MAKRSKVAERVYMVVFMFVISAVFITVVAAVHLATRKTVERNKSLFVKRSILMVAGITPPESPVETEALFQKIVTPQPTENPRYYTVKTANGTKTVLCQRGKGLWGEIIANIGFNADLKTLSGIHFIEQSETPGLGARISEPWFQKQFIGKSAPFTFVPEKTKSGNKHEFDAITGATVSTTAVRDMVNEASKRIKTVTAGGK